MAEDGDPLDALAVHDSATYSGGILPCRALGVVAVTQKGKHGREDNPRLILMPGSVNSRRRAAYPNVSGRKLSSSSPARPSVGNRHCGLSLKQHERAGP
jgi:hypothetical protein